MKSKLPIFIYVVLPLACSPLASAQAVFTGPPGGDYATTSNWSGSTIPGNSNNLDAWIGSGGNTPRSAIYQTATGYTSAGRLIVGLSGPNVGTFTMQTSAGTLTFAGDDLNNANYIGVDGGTGTLNANAGTLALTGMTNGGGHLHIGANAGVSTGTLNIGGGIVNVGTRVTLGTANAVPVAGNGTGTITITSGSLNIAATSSVGDGDKGVLYMKAGGADTGSATLNLNGGLINLTRFSIGGGSSAKTINLNGGTIQANASSTTFLPTGSTNNVGNSGGTIDTQANDITIAGSFLAAPLSTTSVLTKTGSGTLTLSGTGHTVGKVDINQGKLALTGSASISNVPTIHIGPTATFDVSGVSGGSWTLASGQTLTGTGTLLGTGTNVIISGTHSPGNSPGLQTIAANTSYSSSSIFNWELIGNTTSGRGTNYDGVDITGTLTIDSAATFNISTSGGVSFSDPFWNSPQTWSVFTATSTISGLFAEGANFSNAEGSFSLSSGSGAVSLNWSPVPEPTSALAAILVGAGLMRRRR